MLKKFIFQIIAALLNILFIKDITVSTKIQSTTTVFNIYDGNKWFFSTKSAYKNDLWMIIGDWNIYVFIHSFGDAFI